MSEALFAAATTPFDFSVYGVLGVVVAAFLAGFIWPKPAVDRLIRDKEKAEAQRDALSQMVETKVIPALIESNTLGAVMKPLLEELARLVKETAAAQRQGRL